MSITPYGRGLTLPEMQVNAREIADYLTEQGWSKNAIAAVLGNFQDECALNPNNPQNEGSWPGSASYSSGFGLPQWTPWYERYGKWCQDQGIAFRPTDDNPSGQIIPQLQYLDHEATNGYSGGATWLNRGGYSYTWEEFKVSTDSPDELARAFYWQYERSGSGDPTERPEYALYWYNFLWIPTWLLFRLKRKKEALY